MQTVSADYLTAIVATEREIVQKCEITFLDNVILGSSVTPSAGECYPSVLPDDNAVDGRTVVHRDMAYADYYDESDVGCRDTVYPRDDLYPVNAEAGWWGDTLSDASGNISGGETLTLDYGATPVTLLSVSWWANDFIGYPVDFVVEYYNGSAWIELADISGNTLTEWILELSSAISAYDLRITITKMSRGYSYAKLLEFEGGLRIDLSERVARWNILKEREFEGGSLPIGNASANSLTLELDNTDGEFFRNSGSIYAPYLLSNRKIRIWVGCSTDSGDEYLAQGVFYTRGWSAGDREPIARVSAWDQAKLMKEQDYVTSQVVEGYTISELVEMLGDDFGLGSSEMVIGATTSVVNYAWFDQKSYWSHLKDLAIGEGGTVYFDELDRLVFENRDYLAGKTSSVATLTDLNSNVDIKEGWEQERMRNYVVVPSIPLTPDSEQEVCNLVDAITIPVSGPKGVTVYFSSKPVINVSTPVITADPGITVQSWTAYAWGGYLVLVNGGWHDGDVTQITIDGQPLVELGGIRAISKDDQLIDNNGKRVYSVPNAGARFIQTLDVAEDLADDLLASLKDPGSEITGQLRGRPELQLGDRVTIQNTRASIDGDYWITRINLEYNGGLMMETTLVEVV